ncbi:MAG: fasciclin domain-containing protein [Vicinamibacteraceae bacterium]
MLKSLALTALAAVALTIAPITAAPAAAQTKDIVDTAVAAGSFKTLAAALKAAGLIDTLKGPGPFTVFAPTDEAFAKLPAGTVETLLKPENKAKLTRILTYHVVAGKVMAADAAKLTSATAVSGDTLTIAANGSGVTIDKAKVVKADIAASNGVIHVIDTVILPKDS